MPPVTQIDQQAAQPVTQLDQLLDAYRGGDTDALGPLYDLLLEADDPRAPRLQALAVFPPEKPEEKAIGYIDNPLSGSTPLLLPTACWQLVELQPDSVTLYTYYPTEARASAAFHRSVLATLANQPTSLQKQYRECKSKLRQPRPIRYFRGIDAITEESFTPSPYLDPPDPVPVTDILPLGNSTS